ncbi:MAG TPA: hypothetical protein DDZ33_10660 [Clostridium sp.]|uniref:DUF58 domain-containing protein n=1 Tax=Clostridium sp. UBA3061 TaxID=1946353 RepID=UPI000E9E8299|nr:hypothetical protein [Clostridium sp.]
MLKIKKSYFILTILSYIFALFSGGNLPYSIFYCLLLVLIITSIYIYFVSKNLNIDVVSDKKEIIAGENNNIIIKVYNDSIFPISYMEIENSLLKRIMNKYRGDIISIKINGNKFIKKDIKIPIRGDYRLGSTTSIVSDIFGVFTWKCSYSHKETIKVYPSIYTLKSIKIKGANLREFNTKTIMQELNKGPESLETIKNIREYRIGDSYRRVNWKVTAKHGKLFVKEYESSESPRIHVFLDLRKDPLSMDKDGVREEELVEFFLSLIKYMQEKSANSQAIIIGENTEVFNISNKEHLEGLKTHMVSKYSEGRGKLPLFMKKFMYNVNKKSAVVIVTYDMSKENIDYFINLSTEGYEVTLFYLDKIPKVSDDAISHMLNKGINCYSIEEIR